jgi:Protein of unknown function (DUF3761)
MKRSALLGLIAAPLLAAVLLAPAYAADAAVTVTCKDGSSATGGRGACRGHGGVNKGGAAPVARQAAPVAAPAAAPASVMGETVTCKDGATSKAGRGACRGHGGVNKGGAAPVAVQAATPATKPAPAPTAKRPAPAPMASSRPAAPASGDSDNNSAAGATAHCKDGTYSHAQHRTGACSRHGGVAEWMSAQ